VPDNNAAQPNRDSRSEERLTKRSNSNECRKKDGGAIFAINQLLQSQNANAEQESSNPFLSTKKQATRI